MSQNPFAAFSFTKLVVHDLEAMAQFYSAVFGLKALHRIKAAIDTHPIDEIIMSSSDDFGAGPTLVLLKFLEKAKPQPGAVILGFVTPDLEALIARARKAGGDVAGQIVEPEGADVRAGFVVDPEGHMIEVVQML